MSAHLHPAPQCTSPHSGCVPNPNRCAHKACKDFESFTCCELLDDGQYYCAHGTKIFGDKNDHLPNNYQPKFADPKVAAKYAPETPAKAKDVDPAAWDPMDDPASIAPASGPKYEARVLIHEFAKRNGECKFPHFNDRQLIAKQLVQLIEGKKMVNAGHTSLCGPASFLQGVLDRDPATYVRYVTSLFENGEAYIGKLKINPSAQFRQEGGNRVTPAVDVIAMGSLRACKNSSLFKYHIKDDDGDSFAGGTTTGELVDWFQAAGYKPVLDYTEWSKLGFTNQSSPRAKAELASEYLNRGYQVVLSVSQKLEGSPSEQAEWGGPDHVAVLTSPIGFDAQGNATFTVFDDGKQSTIRASFKNFSQNFYGFVAAKP
jgi:hypothetical protein